MGYDFDRIIDRTNTDSLKYDFAKRRGYPEDVLPLWVADMDFATPDQVTQALVAKAQHGIFGYSEGREDYYEAVAAWFDRYFDWQVQSKWLVKTPGVVYAVTTAIRAFTDKGHGVLIQEPVYYPFREAIEVNERQVVVNELVYHEGAYDIDFEDFEQKILENDVKLFILCSPHNPVGRVWTEKELITMGQICLKHQVLVVSDEIHCDFTYPGHSHHVFANLKEAYLPRTITCTAPSKTFNLAALQLSNVFISDRDLRGRFKAEMTRSGYSQPNIMGLVSCEAAYTYGHEWLKELKHYLKDNLRFFTDYLGQHLPEAIVVQPEGTYLVWVDLSQVSQLKHLSDKALDTFMVHEAKLWLDGGTMFGQGGSGFQRFNIACPRSVLEKAVEQLVQACNNHKG